MRIVDPRSFNKIQQPKSRLKVGFWLAIILIGVAGSIVLFWPQSSQKQEGTSETVTSSVNEPSKVVENVDNVKDTLRIFSDNEFKSFYDNLLLPNLLKVENPPVITGNDIADARIRKIAEDRGYRLRSSSSVELKDVEGNLLQTQVAENWKSLKATAVSKGLKISIVSGYRSVETQRSLFLQRLSVSGESIESVASGKSDAKVNELLATTSIPGYSKHHTGYTIDILCAGYVFENFKNSPCNDWIKADNYKVAKENGFIPSYPPLADAQGPDPEAWEYVWVGTELLYE